MSSLYPIFDPNQSAFRDYPENNDWEVLHTSIWVSLSLINSTNLVCQFIDNIKSTKWTLWLSNYGALLICLIVVRPLFSEADCICLVAKKATKVAPNMYTLIFTGLGLDRHDINAISRIIGLNQVNACIEKTVIPTDKQMHCIQIELHEMSFQNIIMKVNHEIDLELILHCKHCVLQHVLLFYTYSKWGNWSVT